VRVRGGEAAQNEMLRSSNQTSPSNFNTPLKMTIRTTELLKLFAKANQLDLSVVVREDNDSDYVIKITERWGDDFNASVIINQNGLSNWSKGDYNFDAMMDVLDEMLEEKRKQEIKELKRRQLISRLTDEERELLGVT
jgi:hypothetical protein